MRKRPPLLLGLGVLAVAAAVLSVSWFMSLRAGNRLAAELDAAEGDHAILASRTPGDWADVTLQSDRALQFSLDGPATAASAALPPGVEVPASATPRPWHDGDRLDFCSPGLPSHAVVVVRGLPGEPQELRLDVGACPFA